MSNFKSWSKLFVLVLLVFAFAGCGFIANEEERYEYICKGADGSSFFLDKLSITPINSQNIFQCWYKNVVSNSLRQRYVNSRRVKKR